MMSYAPTTNTPFKSHTKKVVQLYIELAKYVERNPLLITHLFVVTANHFSK